MKQYLQIFFLVFFFLMKWDSPGALAQSDSTRVISLNLKVQAELSAGNVEQAQNDAQQAALLADKISYLRGKAVAILLLGKIHQRKGNFDESLNYYLQAAELQQNLKDKPAVATTYLLIGQLYQEKESYEKTLAYFRSAYQVEQQLGNRQGQLQLEQAIGQAYYQLKKYPEAISYYKIALDKYKTDNNRKGTTETLNRLASLSILNSQYQEAIDYYQQLLPVYRHDKDTTSLASTLNNMGYIERELNQPRKAFDYFAASLALYKMLHTTSRNNEKKAVLSTNIGVIYSNMGYYESAEAYFEEALRISEAENQHTRVAEIHNYLATSALIVKRYDDALGSALNSLEVSLPHNLKPQARDTYKILSDIYQQQNEYKKSQQYFKLYTELNTEVEKENERKKQERLQKQVELEKKESETKLGLAERQRQELLVKQLQLETERKAQELALQERELAILKKDADLQAAALLNQKLEKIRVERELQLAREKIASDAREKELTLLQKDKALKDLELQKQKLLEKEQQESINMLQAEARLKQQKLDDEARQRIYTYGIMGLFFCIIVGVVIAYLRDIKKSRKLREQALRIRDQNEELLTREEELRQNMEELEATSERLMDVNTQLNAQQDELEKKNHNITASINAAQRIQGAMLPTEQDIKKALPEHFVMFKPKDIVSGDFYWFAEQGNKAIIAAVDCTGHGVPGAFMSMIGDSLLNQIVHDKKITDADEILNQLHKRVRKALKQEDGTNQEGMDMALCVIDFENKVMDYAGAKNPMVLIQRDAGNNPVLVDVKADKTPIGGRQKEAERRFTRQTFPLEHTTMVYLFSDGFQDQFGGPDDKKFSVKRMKEIFLKIHEKSMGEQLHLLERVFMEWKGENDQIDDVLIVGVKLEESLWKNRKAQEIPVAIESEVD